MSSADRKKQAKEDEEYWERIRLYHSSEEARKIRLVAFRAALLGGLLALLGSVVATVLTRWIDRRPIVNVAPVVRVDASP